MRTTGTMRFAGLLLTAGLWFGGAAAQDEAMEDERAMGSLPLVVMQQVEISGRVFFIADQETPDRGAPDLQVQVKPLDGGDVIQETKTDGQGNFTLKKLDVARYQLHVGRVELELRVEKPGEDMAKGATVAPKKILVFLPHELAEEAR